MPLFRKKSQSQAERLASWRSEALAGARAGRRRARRRCSRSSAPSASRAPHAAGSWSSSGGTLFITTIDDGTTLSGWSPIEDTHDAGELRGAAAPQPRSRGSCGRPLRRRHDELGARFAVPLDGFDRGAVLLALETMAATLGDEALADARPRGCATRPRGEAAEQDANARAAGAVDARRSRRARPARRGRPRAPRRVAGRRSIAASSRPCCATPARACS